ncbi:MAG: phosphatase PAP2 family protein [Gemmatimonadota bacterium]|nr:phosphatase PAP2 family protein [Gemmatimonadota bacterium]
MTEFFFGPAPIITIQEFFGRGWPTPFHIASLLGDTWGVLLVFGIAFWLWGRQSAYPLAGIILVEAATNLAINQLIHLPRPDATGIVKYVHVPMGSFPSGHVYTATVLWGFLYATGRVPLAVPILVSIAVGLGRLYLGTHFVGDVLGGAAFGVMLVFIFVRVWPRVHTWLSHRSDSFFENAAALGFVAGIGSIFFVGRNARAWEAAGVLAAAAIGLLLEWRRVRYDPIARSPRRRLQIVAMGVAGIAASLLVDRFVIGNRALALGAVLAGIATLWTVLVFPALLSRSQATEQ